VTGNGSSCATSYTYGAEPKYLTAANGSQVLLFEVTDYGAQPLSQIQNQTAQQNTFDKWLTQFVRSRANVERFIQVPTTVSPQ